MVPLISPWGVNAEAEVLRGSYPVPCVSPFGDPLLVRGWSPNVEILSSLRDFVPVGAALLRVNTRSYALSSLRDFPTQAWMKMLIVATEAERRSRGIVSVFGCRIVQPTGFERRSRGSV